MENASKALIIAGAILISILLIGVGMVVFTSAQGGIDEALSSMSEQEKTIFNQKFTAYKGDKIKGTNVKALLTNVMTSNSQNRDIDGKLVEVTGEGKTATPTTANLQEATLDEIRNAINTGATYKVLMINNDAGLVNKITITKN